MTGSFLPPYTREEKNSCCVARCCVVIWRVTREGYAFFIIKIMHFHLIITVPLRVKTGLNKPSMGQWPLKSGFRHCEKSPGAESQPHISIIEPLMSFLGVPCHCVSEQFIAFFNRIILVWAFYIWTFCTAPFAPWSEKMLDEWMAPWLWVYQQQRPQCD